MSHEDELTALPSVVRPAAALVPGPAPTGQPRLHHLRCGASGGAARPGGRRRSISELVRRHEVLRTTFPSVWTAGPSRSSSRTAPLEVPLTDLRSFPPESGRPSSTESLADEAARPSTHPAPLLRAFHLCGSADSEHVLLLAIHHIVSDGWSVGVLLAQSWARSTPRVRRGRAQLAARAAGAVRRLRGLAARSWLPGPRSGGAARYWRERLADAPPCSTCPPTGRARRSQTLPGPPLPIRARRRTRRRRCRGLARQRGRHALHDAAGRLPGPAPPLHRAGRRAASARRSPAGRARARGADRLLRQHPGAAHRPVSASRPSASCCAGARARAGRLRPPGRAVREAGRGAAAGARPAAHAALPGDVRAPEHAAGRAGPPRRPDGRPSDRGAAAPRSST